MDIPNSYRVGGQVVETQFVEHLDGNLGRCCLGAGWLKIAKIFKEEKQTESSMFNTFNHELVHTILDTMGKDELSRDEVFVNTFASFLTESVLSMEFWEDK